MKQLLASLALAGAFTVAGCSSHSQSQASVNCQPQSWQEQGFEDATAGAQPDILRTYQSECEDQFEKANADRYKLGFFLGLTEFCSYENGYQKGLQAEIEPHACPMEQKQKFEQGQKDGYRKYLANTGQENSLTRVSRDFESLQRQKTFDQNMGAGDGSWTSTWEKPSTGR